jgi:hypothetical protein
LPSRIELKSNPFPFILNKGDPLSILQILTSIDRLRTQAGFDNLAAVISMQNKDGGFPRNLQKGQPSSIKATYRVLQILHKTGVNKHSFIMASALDWLLKWQETDGGWHENMAVALPEWMTWESTSQSVTWYTCQVGRLLQQLRMQKTNAFRKIVDFFINSELPGGGWSTVVGRDKSDPDSTTGIGDFLAPIVGKQNPTVYRAKSRFESTLTKLLDRLKSERIEDAYELTHLVFEDAPYLMYGKGDKRIRALLEALIKAQRKDGGWLTFYSEGKSDVPITVFSLKALLSHGIIAKTVLQKAFDSAITTHSRQNQ